MEATKSHVLAKVQAERRGWEINLFNLAGEEFDGPGVVGEWSIKDLLANLLGALFLHRSSLACSPKNSTATLDTAGHE